jgi:hypothetical protein
MILPDIKHGGESENMAEFCKSCGSLLIQGICTNRRLHDPDFKSCIWLLNGQEYRFRVAVTRVEAERAVREQSYLVLKQAVVPENRHIKPWTEGMRG